MTITLSVLDLSPVGSGYDARTALANSMDLARAVEGWGYHRFWVAEHHNMPGIASAAPAVLIGHVAQVTSRMRVGSGGVMLPNHPPLVVAEQFGMLEALHPGRIDLGIGRAPGTDPTTAAALRRTTGTLSVEDFPEQLRELADYFSGKNPILATPAVDNYPQVWLLGSSGYSAQVAGALGLPFAFAHHFSPANTMPALELYRSTFRPSAVLNEPYVVVGAAAIAADDAERAAWLAGPSALSFLRMQRGNRPAPLATPKEAAEYPYTELDQMLVEERLSSHIIGDQASVHDELAGLAERTGADELMITTMVHDHEDRLRSYELIAESFGIERGTHARD